MEGVKPNRLCLWGTVRSNTNVLLNAFVNMGPNCRAIRKSYFLPYFYGEEKQEDRFQVNARPNATYRDAKEYLEQDFGGQDVVAKDVAYHLRGRTHNMEAIPQGYKHLIVIRDHRETIASLYNKPRYHEDTGFFKPAEAGYEEVNELYDTLLRETGVSPVIIDSDQLLKNPEKILKKVCQQLEIPFCDEMIDWRPETSNIINNIVHLPDHRSTRQEYNKQATRLEPKSKTSTLDVATLPEEVQEAIEKARPIYERLYNLSVKVE